MLRLTAEETARAVGGRVIFGDEKQVITHISLDSRTAAKGDLFCSHHRGEGGCP